MSDEATIGRREIGRLDESGSPPGDRPPSSTADRARGHRLVAGYIPEVNILNGCNLTVERGRVRRHHRPQRRRQVDAAEGDPRPVHGALRHGARSATSEITGQQGPRAGARWASATCRRSRNVFPSLTVRENLEMGCYLRPSHVRRPLRVRHRRCSRGSRERAGAARRRAVGRRAPDGGDGSGADDGAEGAAARRAVGRASRRRCRTRCSCAAGGSTQEGVAILMVEQNARRCLQVVHRGYVLDQGQQRLHRHRPRPARRPRRDRAVPRHAGQGHRRLSRQNGRAPGRPGARSSSA